MIVFKTYWKILKKNLPLVILYSVILIGLRSQISKQMKKILTSSPINPMSSLLMTMRGARLPIISLDI